MTTTCNYDYTGAYLASSSSTRCNTPLTPASSTTTGNTVCRTYCPNISGLTYRSGIVQASLSLTSGILPIDTLTCANLSASGSTVTCSYDANSVRRCVLRA